MREIKFKLRYSETKQVVGYCEIWGGQLHYSINNQDWSNEPITMESIRKRKGKIDWEQYTGLKDKNGKEIYEGDIVKDRTVSEEVKYGGSNCGCCNGVYGFYTDGRAFNCIEDYEVIGNIYENPELLKGNK